jgi:PIN domain-containing protein
LSFVFFADRDLGRQFPEILRSAGLKVERHHDYFAPDVSDETWLAAVGQRGWVALTHDQRIRFKPNERAAVMRHGVALLVIIGKAPYPELARAFVATLPRVERFLTGHTPPYIAKVYRPFPAEITRSHAAGHVELWHPR